MRHEALKSRGKNKPARLVALRIMLAIIKETTIDLKSIEKSGHTAFFAYSPQNFWAISWPCLILAHCCSMVSSFPESQEAKPHWWESRRRSFGRTVAAFSSRSRTRFSSSNPVVLLESSPKRLLHPCLSKLLGLIHHQLHRCPTLGSSDHSVGRAGIFPR